MRRGYVVERRSRTSKTVRYQAGWYEGDKQRTKHGFAKKSEAQRYADEMQRKAQSDAYLDSSRGQTSFRVVAEEWAAATLLVDERKPRTIGDYRAILDKRILPIFGDRPVGSIRRADVERFKTNMQGEALRPGTIRNVMFVLRPILEFAVNHEYIARNPAQGVKLPRLSTISAEEMLFLTAEEVSALVSELPEHWRLMVLLTAYTGMRAGEVEALQVKHVDLMKRRITVARSASVVTGVPGPTYTTPKNGKVRTVPLAGFLRDALAEHLAPIATDREALVFTAPGGGPVSHGNFMGRAFRPALRRAVKAGTLPATKVGLRFHDLRHTAASLLISLNANPKQVSAMLGHSTVSITFDRYGHLFPGHDDHLAEGLDRLYTRAQAAPLAAVVSL